MKKPGQQIDRVTPPFIRGGMLISFLNIGGYSPTEEAGVK